MPNPRNLVLLLGAISIPAGALPPADSNSNPVSATASPSISVSGTGAQSRPATKGAAAGKASAVPKARKVSVAMAEGLRFDPPRFEAKAGELLQIQLENVDPSHLAHNFAIIKPGLVQEVVKMAMDLGDAGPGSGFVPTHPGIIAASSKVVDPEKKLSITFTVPSEPGVYGYACTVPGHGMVMYGAMYVDVPPPPLAKDPNIPQLTLEKGLAGAGKRPFVQRMFLPDAGPAAIAVALPGNQNYCFDAGACRLRYAWEGLFLDAGGYWRGNGSKLGELGDEPWWRSKGFPLRLGDSKGVEEKVKFLGYHLTDGIPEFHFRVGTQEVFESVSAVEKGLEIHFRLPGISQKVSFYGEAGPFAWSSKAGDFHSGVLEVPPDRSGEFQVKLESRPAESQGAQPPKSTHSSHPPTP